VNGAGRRKAAFFLPSNPQKDLQPAHFLVLFIHVRVFHRKNRMGGEGSA